MSKPKHEEQRQAGRPRIGPVREDPVTGQPDLSQLSPQQRALREAVLKEFQARKARNFVEKQIEHIDTNRRVSEGIQFLFDEQGHPPPNAPLEDIVAERERIEYHIRWFEAMLAELKNQLVKVREIEDYAFETMYRNLPEERLE
jgi:hypothetical protein